MQKIATRISLLLVFAAFVFTCLSCEKPNLVLQGYIEGKYTYVTSAVAGTLNKLFVERGTQVKAGQLLFVLDPQPEAAELDAAQQKLAQAEQTLEDMKKGGRSTILAAIVAQKEQVQASLELSQKTISRYQSLYKVGAIDKASVDQAEAAYKNDLKKLKQMDANLAEAKLGQRENMILAQQAVVDAAKATIKQVSWSLEQKTQRAPIDALVFDTIFIVGEMVTAGAPVVSLLAAKDVKMIFYVPEKNLSQIKLGEKISFSCDNCKQIFSAKINFISPEAEFTPPVIYSKDSREKLVYRVEAALDAQNAFVLHPGQPVNVNIPIALGSPVK